MKVAVVHPGTLLGKEVCQQLESRPGDWGDVQLYSTLEEEVGTVTGVGGAAGFVQRADAEGLDGVGLAFLCGPLEADRSALGQLPAAARAVLLSPGAGVEDPPPAVAGIRRAEREGERRLTSPHPAAVALALLAAPLARFEPRRLTATIALPVSADADDALEALFEETRRILAFQAPPASARARPQRAFNLLPDDSEDARVEEQLAAVLGGGLPVGVQLVRAGVFHGLLVGAFFELAKSPPAAELRKALAGGAVELARRPASVGPVAVAGADKLVVGGVRATAGGYAVWAAMDNLVRGGALNAIELAEEMLAAAPV